MTTDVQKWLNNVEIIFNDAKKRNPPAIYRSEVDSLLIGLRAVSQTPKVQKLIEMLEKYSTLMKSKGRKFLKIKT